MILVFAVPTTITSLALNTAEIISASGDVVLATGKLTDKCYIRKAPDENAGKFAYYAKGDTAYIIDLNVKDGWYGVVTRIKGNVYKGFVQSQYFSRINKTALTATPEGAAYVTYRTQNAQANTLGIPIHIKASSSSSVMGIYENDSVIKVLDYDYNPNFSKIDCGGYIGYIRRYYVKVVVENQTLDKVGVRGTEILKPGESFPDDYTSTTQGVVLKSTNWNSQKIDYGTTYILSCTFETTNGNKFDTNKDKVKGTLNGEKTMHVKSVTPTTLTVFAYIKSEEKAPASYGEDVKFAGGSGTESDPYLIKTADQLNAIRFHLTKHYKLISNIDLSKWGQWLPIGDDISYKLGLIDKESQGMFTGTFDGNGHYVKGMRININQEEPYLTGYGAQRQSFGLFNGASSSSKKIAAIKNLGVVDSRINIKYTRLTGQTTLLIGNICGHASNTTLSKCWTKNCKINVDLTKAPINGAAGNKPWIFYGGIVGNAEAVYINDCGNSSSFNLKLDSVAGAQTQLGGIAGYSSMIRINRSFNTGSITVPKAKNQFFYTGGMIGYIHDSFQENNHGYITDCYNTGKLTGGNTIAGMCGYSNGRIYYKRCYNTGKITSCQYKDNITIKASHRPSMVSCYANGKSVSGKAWTYSSKYNRKILKNMPESKVK